MKNALSALGGPPPAPNPDPTSGQGDAPPLPANALMSQSAPQQQPQQAAAPAPSHLQTVAALRHFRMIENELMELLSSPELGKSDMHSAIIDGATKLVADGVMKPSEAVMQLGQVPERPFDQKVFLEKQLALVVQAQNGVLDHHRAAFAGAGPEIEGNPYNTDDHHSIMSGLLGHYQGLQKEQQ